ncbi:hypothetical protein ACTID9_23125 [Brevibacillus fluminis]|uniref:hypothetical protein n=1 Tax=Brevibacillus fluminis TaxID=511487 RepID=UPI003F887F60
MIAKKVIASLLVILFLSSGFAVAETSSSKTTYDEIYEKYSHVNQGKQKGYGDMTDNEKKAIDKTMDNVTEQNKKIIEAKEKWVAADKAGDVKGKQEAEKAAKEAREKGGTIDKDEKLDKVKEREKELNDKIDKAKEKWKEADKIKDPVERQKAKDAAHEEANKYRSEGGTRP